MTPTVANSGAITDETSGERHIPESIRPDGTTRKAIRIRPGYRPAEDIELYRARNAVAFRERRRMGVPGTTAPEGENQLVQAASSSSSANNSMSLSWRSSPNKEVPGASGSESTSNPATLSWRSNNDDIITSAVSSKNAKRREARKKAKATESSEAVAFQSQLDTQTTEVKADNIDREADRERKVRNLKKKLKQAKDLKTKKDEGEGLLPEQIAKVIKINELIRELEALGFDKNCEPTKDDNSTKNDKRDA
ncbi:hypothetical protein NQ176_g5180 [Zarea fungicola]|uniref:Uncharacterized protein n=1 Tax=Zarea fungicola TaxID=93591 RepID=A0ACC1NC10_9HYPO|nr:hypothetical protein NQ176_g5180 [Lecanicillium fungicola]